jgi:predicted RNase H-like HicB family nuclease
MSHPSLCGYSRKEALAEMKDFLEQVVGTHWEEDAKANPEFGEFQVNVRDEIKIGRG